MTDNASSDAGPSTTPAPDSPNPAAPAAPYRLEPLTASHDVGGFSCGETPEARAITSYLREQALVEHTAGLNSVTVVVETATNQVSGFFTLSPLSIPINTAVLTALGLSEVQYRSVGGYLLGRLGVAAARQGAGLGAALVTRAVDQATRGRLEGLGGAFLAVDAKDERLVEWYRKLGFTRLDSNKRRVVRRLQ